MCLIQKESKFICLFRGSKQDGEVVLVVLVNTLIQAILGKKEKKNQENFIQKVRVSHRTQGQEWTS